MYRESSGGSGIWQSCRERYYRRRGENNFRSLPSKGAGDTHHTMSPPPASIASCELICQVIDVDTIDTFVESVFTNGEKHWAKYGGSPMMRWYRNVSPRNGNPNVPKGESGEGAKAKGGSVSSRRLIAWKTSKSSTRLPCSSEHSILEDCFLCIWPLFDSIFTRTRHYGGIWTSTEQSRNMLLC